MALNSPTHFGQEIRNLHATHWHTYPKCPQQNSYAERFNRTLQEEYIDYQESKLKDPEIFNIGLMKHLLWHNTKQPHFGINLQTPVNYIMNNGYPLENCNMYLTNTRC